MRRDFDRNPLTDEPEQTTGRHARRIRPNRTPRPVPVAAPQQVVAAGTTNGSMDTAAGPIVWSTDNGMLTATGGGMRYTATSATDPDGTEHDRAVFAGTFGVTYLTIESAVRNADRSVSVTLQAGDGELTVAVTGIDARMTAGTATVTGTYAAAPVAWTGPVDLTSNPFTGTALPGWPHGAFAAELERAAYFAPLMESLASSAGSTPSRGGGGGTHPAGGGRFQQRSVTGVVGRATAWCLGGAIAASGASPATLPASMALGCIGGALASGMNDLVSWMDEDHTVEQVPIPVFDIPTDPEPIGPIVVTVPDDPPPPPVTTDPGNTIPDTGIVTEPDVGDGGFSDGIFDQGGFGDGGFGGGDGGFSGGDGGGSGGGGGGILDVDDPPKQEN